MNLLNDMRIHTLFLFHSGKRRKLLLGPAKIAAYAMVCLCGDLLLVNAGEASFADNNSAVYNRVIYIAFISNGAKHGADIKLRSMLIRKKSAAMPSAICPMSSRPRIDALPRVAIFNIS